MLFIILKGFLINKVKFYLFVCVLFASCKKKEHNNIILSDFEGKSYTVSIGKEGTFNVWRNWYCHLMYFKSGNYAVECYAKSQIPDYLYGFSFDGSCKEDGKKNHVFTLTSGFNTRANDPRAPTFTGQLYEVKCH